MSKDQREQGTSTGGDQRDSPFPLQSLLLLRKLGT